MKYIKRKLKQEPDVVVIERNGKKFTLKEVFESLGLSAYDLSVDLIDVHSDKSMFHRFDRFNVKYNPIGESRLREIFMKTNNYIKGRYLGELTRETLDYLEESKYQLAEPRVSVYGRSKNEWDMLADWALDNKLRSPNARYLIQV